MLYGRPIDDNASGWRVKVTERAGGQSPVLLVGHGTLIDKRCGSCDAD